MGAMYSAPASNKERQMVVVPEFEAWAAQQGLKMSPEMHVAFLLAVLQEVFEVQQLAQQQAQPRSTPEFDLRALLDKLDEEADEILQKLRQQQLQQDQTPVDTLMSLLRNQFRQAFNNILSYFAWMMQHHPQQIMQSPAFDAYQRMMRMAPGMFPNGMAEYVDDSNMETMLAVQSMQMAQLAGAAAQAGPATVVPYVPGGAP